MCSREEMEGLRRENHNCRRLNSSLDVESEPLSLTSYRPHTLMIRISSHIGVFQKLRLGNDHHRFRAMTPNFPPSTSREKISMSSESCDFA